MNEIERKLDDSKLTLDIADKLQALEDIKTINWQIIQYVERFINLSGEDLKA